MSAGDERSIKIWDVDSGRLRQTVNEEAESLAVSPDGRMLAFSGRDPGYSGNEPCGRPSPADGDVHDDTVWRLAFSPDGKLIASVSADNTAKIWNVATGALQSTLRGHSNQIYGVAFSPDGALLATASWDATVRLWRVAGGALVATLFVVDKNDWLVMTPDGLFDGSPGAWSRILLRFSPALRDVAPVDLFFADYFHPGLLTELIAGRHPLPPRAVQQVDRRQPQLKLHFDVVGGFNAPDLRHMKIAVEVASAPHGARDARLFRTWHVGQSVARRRAAR